MTIIELNLKNWNENIFKEFCKRGNFFVVREYTRLHPNENFTSGFLLASEEGHLDVVRYLAEVKTSGVIVDVTTDTNHAVRMASRNGHLEVVNFLLETRGN